MSLLDNRAGSAGEEASWQEFLRETGVGRIALGDERVRSGSGLVCHWVADPGSPGRLVCAWGPRPSA